MSYNCNKCHIGRMEPDCQEGEPEYTDTFKCNNPDCGTSAVIPSIVIILSQLFSAIAGALLSGYLLLFHFSKLVSAENPGIDGAATSDFALRHGVLSAVGFGFILCFGFLFYKAVEGILIRRHFKRITR